MVLGVLAALILAGAQSGPPPDMPVDSNASMDGGAIRVGGQAYSLAPPKAPLGEPARARPRSALKRICNTGSDPGTCGRSIFCPDQAGQEREAYWRLTAPAGASGPDAWTNTNTVVCRNAQEQGAQPVVLSVTQFRRLPIPPARITVQPNPATRPTLVNIETNLYTTSEQPVMATTVLGAPVRVRATPARYRWTYGDGAALTTTKPGGAYPNMPTAHVYTRPGTYRAGLTTTFTGEFSVRGGPWQPVDGTASVATDPVTVTAVEARAELVP